jgi:hypothetical protein
MSSHIRMSVRRARAGAARADRLGAAWRSHDARDPSRLDLVISQMVAERGWALGSAGSGIRDRWAAIVGRSRRTMGPDRLRHHHPYPRRARRLLAWGTRPRLTTAGSSRSSTDSSRLAPSIRSRSASAPRRPRARTRPCRRPAPASDGPRGCRTRTAQAALDPEEFPVLTSHLTAVLPAMVDHQVYFGRFISSSTPLAGPGRPARQDHPVTRTAATTRPSRIRCSTASPPRSG